MTREVMEDAILLDANIAIYALSRDSPLSLVCEQFITDIARGKGRGYASVEMIQEVVHHRLRRTGNPKLAAQEGRALMSTLIVLNFDYEVLDTSLKLVEQLPGARGRDAVHAATALVYGIPKIASTDRAFDDIPGITRVDPTAARPTHSDTRG